MGKGRSERVQEVPLLQLPLHNDSGRGSGNVQLRAVGQWYMKERKREMLARDGGWGATGRGSVGDTSGYPNMWMGVRTAVQRWALCWAQRWDRRGEVSTALLFSVHFHPLHFALPPALSASCFHLMSCDDPVWFSLDNTALLLGNLVLFN